MRPAPALCAVALLAACASLNPVTLARLALLDPLTADPAGFEVALDLPSGLGLHPDGAHLVFRAQRAGVVSEARYPLELRPGQPPLWRIAPESLPALRQQQAIIAAWEAADPDGTSGSLSIDLAPCRTGAGPAPDATVDVSLRIEPGGALLPLVRGGAIAEVADADTVAQLPACDGAQ